MDPIPAHFIDEPIDVDFEHTPLLEKKPGCPSAFVWNGVRYQVVEMLREWHDYRRKGRMAQNMRDDHLATASGRGSWGVGRDYYRVRVESGQVFDLYYDRAPKGSDQRKGGWVLYRELLAPEK